MEFSNFSNEAFSNEAFSNEGNMGFSNEAFSNDPPKVPKDAIVKCFRQFDMDGSGFVNREEVKNVMMQLDQGIWHDGNVKRLLDMMDMDGDGLLDYEEFASWITNHGGRTEVMMAGKVAMERQPAEEEEKVEEQVADDEGLVVSVQFLGGEEVSILVGVEDTVAELRAKIEQHRPLPAGKVYRLLRVARVLKDVEPAAALRGAHVVAVVSAPEMSYRAMCGNEVRLICEGDAGFDEICAKNQVSPSNWVPAPSNKQAVNLARESLGATVTVSSIIWGSNVEGHEKLMNVLRLGSLHGDPRYVGGDNSFIFKERDRDQTMTVDLGKVCLIERVGSMCYGDRWINKLIVDTRADPSEEWVHWGHDRNNHRSGGTVHFDHHPIKARYVRLRTSSGHYGGAGARLGPIFVYGVDGEAPQNEAFTNVAFTN